MKANSRAILVLLTALALPAVSCKKQQATVERPPPEVTVSRPVEREVIDLDEFSGRTQALESVEVQARVQGHLEEIHFTDGQEVKAGQLLFVIDPKPFQAEVNQADARVKIAEAESRLAEAKLQRMEEALKTNAISEVQVIEQRAEKERSVSTIEGAKANLERARLDLAFSRISAPIDGLMSRAYITKGNLVHAQTGPLTTIQRIDELYVYFDVDERAMQRCWERALKKLNLSPGAPLPPITESKIPLSMGLAGEEGFPHTGRIDFIDNRVDPTTGTIPVRGRFGNERRLLLPGYFARVRIPGGDPYRALLVNDRAVGTDQDQKFVLVVDEAGLVHRRTVKLGRAQDDGLRVIASGLKAGERVVVNGIQRARPGSKVNAKEVEMPSRAVAAAAAPQAAAPPAPSTPSSASR